MTFFITEIALSNAVDLKEAPKERFCFALMPIFSIIQMKVEEQVELTV